LSDAYLMSEQTAASTPATTNANDADALALTLTQMRAAWQANVPSYAQRRADLLALAAEVVARKNALVQAVSADFGRRSRHETLLADVMMVLEDIKHTLKHLARWMRTRSVAVDFKAWPASAEIQQKPLGVVGILSPWNYPIQLSLSPLVAAIAAGNHLMLKPSEHTPQTSALLAELLAKVFPASKVQVIQGDAAVAQVFSGLAFDHLMYTGSTSVGRLVMAAAAKHLTPVTLELGGKSPCLIAPDFPIAHAAERVAQMKHLNAGQTCIAPDYVLVAKHHVEEFRAAYRKAIEAAYPDIATNPDYTSIVNQRQFERLNSYLSEAEAAGATIDRICPGAEPESSTRVFAPTLVFDATPEMKVMQEEIFGPILPVLSYERIEDALAIILAHPRPLAFYHFDHQRQRTDFVLSKITAGGVTVNDCALHITQHALPFGGVGPSGMGHYHGHAGFLTFTKQMPVFRQARWSGFWLLKPPFKKLADRAVEFLTRA
jgi:coniferyl-aldehyde dehydrogenase